MRLAPVAINRLVDFLKRLAPAAHVPDRLLEGHAVVLGGAGVHGADVLLEQRAVVAHALDEEHLAPQALQSLQDPRAPVDGRVGAVKEDDLREGVALALGEEALDLGDGLLARLRQRPLLLEAAQLVVQVRRVDVRRLLAVRGEVHILARDAVEEGEVVLHAARDVGLAARGEAGHHDHQPIRRRGLHVEEHGVGAVVHAIGRHRVRHRIQSVGRGLDWDGQAPAEVDVRRRFGLVRGPPLLLPAPRRLGPRLPRRVAARARAISTEPQIGNGRGHDGGFVARELRRVLIRVQLRRLIRRDRRHRTRCPQAPSRPTRRA